jgi:hypothetical protein
VKESFEPAKAREQYITDFIIKQYNLGLTTKGCLGFHGTSLETLRFAIQHGYIPGSQSQLTTGENIKQGDLFFFPLTDTSKFQEIQDNTARYAKNIAMAHHILKHLNFDINDLNMMEAASELVSPQNLRPEFYKKSLETLKLTPNQAEQVGNEAYKMQGFIIGIDYRVTDLFSVLPGDLGENDMRIRTGWGLPIRYILGIKPLGKAEKYFVDFL